MIESIPSLLSPARIHSAILLASCSTRQPRSEARTWPVSSVGSLSRAGPSSLRTWPAVLSLQTANALAVRDMFARYSCRTWATRAMLGTSTSPRSVAEHRFSITRIETRVLPVPHGSTSMARLAAAGIQSVRVPSQASLRSGNPWRRIFTQAATASSCIGRRGSP